jgi:hypothetical protein
MGRVYFQRPDPGRAGGLKKIAFFKH